MPTNMQYRVCPIDGMPQVLIPAGKFIMGDELNGNPNERPRRQVQLSAYWIDLFDVSVAQFQVFCAATGTEAKFQGVGAQPTCPANATWDQAMSYAAWAGRQLPSEAQWEKAARGGLEGKQYPWGDDYDNTKLACHGHGEPVGSYPPNGFGLFDAVGNGPQWCADFYSAKWYETMSLTNPVNLRPDVRYDQPRNRWEARHWIPAEHEEISDQHTTRGGQDWDQDIVQRVACRWPMSSDGLPHFRCVSPCP
jgi:formylglycine-generating enzyme required for sulfatase activity